MQLRFRSKGAVVNHNNIQNPNFNRAEPLREQRSSWFKRTLNRILLGAGLASGFAPAIHCSPPSEKSRNGRFLSVICKEKSNVKEWFEIAKTHASNPLFRANCKALVEYLEKCGNRKDKEKMFA